MISRCPHVTLVTIRSGCCARAVFGPSLRPCDRVNRLRRGSTKGERESLNARVEKLYLERAVGDRLWLPDKLVRPLFRNCAVALLVSVGSVSRARRLSVDE